MRRFRALPALALLGLITYGGLGSRALSPQESGVEDLRAFAKLYGYVRYFHPSDEAASLDWDRFAVYGAGEVLAARQETLLAMERFRKPVWADAMQDVERHLADCPQCTAELKAYAELSTFTAGESPPSPPARTTA